MDENDLEKFEAVLDTGEHSGSVKELINLTQNLDCFEFYSGITSEEELGRMYIQEFDAIPIPEHLIDYIDYEAYGRDVRINEGGSFSGNGYVFDNNSSFIEHYSDRDRHSRRVPCFFYAGAYDPGADGGLQGGERQGRPVQQARPRGGAG